MRGVIFTGCLEIGTEFLRNRSIVLITAALIALGCGYTDYLSGPDYSISVLYFIPVIFAAWFGGRWPGVVISFFSAACWLAAGLFEKKVHYHPVALYWNDGMELFSFLFVSFMMTALKDSLEQQKLLARIDQLTGIPNRRHFYDLASLEINVSRRYGHELTVAYLDIDNFKGVNDSLGHSAGDALLCEVSRCIRESIRKADVVGRLGGDEFALLFPETGRDSAQAVINHVWRKLKDTVQVQWPVTFSIGMITFQVPPASVDEVVNKADELMYAVKRKGKDRLHHQVVGHGNALTSP